MSNIPACHVGYISLREITEDRIVLVKANKIISISQPLEGMPEDVESVIYTASEEVYYLGETIEQILEKLESIHPSLR